MNSNTNLNEQNGESGQQPTGNSNGVYNAGIVINISIISVLE